MPSCSSSYCRADVNCCAKDGIDTDGSSILCCAEKCTIGAEAGFCKPTGACAVCVEGDERCVAGPPVRTLKCVGGQWQNEADTLPDIFPGTPGLQWDGDCGKPYYCFGGGACTNGINPVDPSLFVAWCDDSNRPTVCSLKCKSDYPAFYNDADVCGGFTCAGKLDGTDCVAPGPPEKNGVCKGGNCIGYDFRYELKWNTALGDPNNLDLHLFVEGLGVVSPGFHGPLGGATFMSPDTSDGSTAFELIVVNSPVAGLRYDAYVNNVSGGAWGTNASLMMRRYPFGTWFGANYHPDFYCPNLPWWQVFRGTGPDLTSHTDGTRMMSNGPACLASPLGTAGVTLNASTANLNCLGMPYRMATGYCCRSDAQCLSMICGVATHLCQ
ncbi:MAG: hypothetical protein V1685_04245 [Parcubacteria group bacterium]